MTSGPTAYPAAAGPPPAPPAAPPRLGSPEAVSDVRAAAAVVLALAVLGAALGPLWAWWSPARSPGVLYPSGAVYPITNTMNEESWIAGDGRFLVIAVVVGLVAAVVVWLFRGHNRGAVMAAALAVGGVGGALLTDLTGYLTGGGDGRGKYHVQLTDGSVHPYSKQLPLLVHTGGLLVVEAAVAVLVYGLLVAFTARDDLGRPDPVRDRVRPPAPVPAAMSVDAGGDPQHGWGHGDGPGPLQQGQFPPR